MARDEDLFFSLTRKKHLSIAEMAGRQSRVYTYFVLGILKLG